MSTTAMTREFTLRAAAVPAAATAGAHTNPFGRVFNADAIKPWMADGMRAGFADQGRIRSES